MKLVIDDSKVNSRFDEFLASYFPHKSRAFFIKLIKNGDITLNGGSSKPSVRLKINDTITVPELLNFEAVLKPDYNLKLDTVYEDKDIILINKPSGLIMHPGSGHKESTMAAALLALNPDLSSVGSPDRPGIVHRLDKETSGLVLVAKTQQVWDKLNIMFKERQIEKKYLAIVHGYPGNTRGVIDKAIARHKTLRHKMAVDENSGKSATTYYHVLKYYSKLKLSLVELKIVTGRTHQIRVHMASLGCPLIGDIVYGANKKDLPLKKILGADFFNSFLLHAYKLSFTHPADCTRDMHFKVPVTNHFLAALKILKEHI